jgi:hypothetical protein
LVEVVSEVLVRLKPARPAATVFLILALINLYSGISTCAQSMAFTRAQTELSFWGRGDYQPTPQTIEETKETLRGLLQVSPRHPENLELQAHSMLWQAYWSQELTTREALNREAVKTQYLALLSRPAHRQAWSKMVKYASRARNGEVMLQLAQERLELLRPPEI